MFHSVSG